MAVALVLGAVIGVLLVLWWLWSYSHYRVLLSRLPSLPALPLLGHVHLIPYDSADFYDFIRDNYAQFHDDIWKVELGPVRALLIIGKAEVVEALLRSTKHIKKAAEYDLLLPWLGTGLLTSSGDKWHNRRRLLTPAFHFRILQDFLHVFHDQAAILVEKLQERVDKEPFDVFPMIVHCALDIICESVMGTHNNAQGDADSEYVVAVSKISELISNRWKRPWLGPDVIYNNIPQGWEHARCLKILHGFTNKVICERRAEYETNCQRGVTPSSAEESSPIGSKKRLAFLDVLLETARESGLSNEDIREEVDTFMFEGHDTTAAAVGWALHLIGCHPDVQAKIQHEGETVFGGSGRVPTIEDMKELKYLECVIKEALRLFPSVPMFGRVLEEDVQLGRYMCPAGATAVVVVTELHRDERFFPDPDRFDPDRFQPDNSVGRHPYAYVPFSAGPRNCIGQKFALNEEKVILSSIMRHFNIKSTRDTVDMRPQSGIILKPSHGVWLKLTQRK